MILALALLAPLLAGPSPTAQEGWDDFPVFVWRSRHRGEAPPPGLLEPFGGTNRFRSEATEWIGAQGLASYTTNAAGRDDLHLDGGPAWEARVERWIEEQDPTALHRDPCLGDPATRARLHVRLARSLGEVEGDRRPAVSLGDEVSLTPYGNPLDFCRAPHCEARWRAFAEERGLDPNSPDTDQVRLALAADDERPLGPWLARRRFHREELHTLLEELAETTRGRAWPGLLGMTHETAFGGLSVDRAFESVTFLECYAVGASRELLHTRQATDPRTSRSLTTLFLQEESAARLSWRAWEHWMRGGDGLILWHDGLLEDRPERASRIAATVKAIRGLHLRFPERPFRQGVALVHDADSVAFAWLRDILLDGPTWPHRRNGYQQQAGTRERKVQAWLRLFEDAGVLPGALDVARLDASASERFPILVLPELGVLGSDDVEALEAHLDRGGTLILDGPLGVFDRAGRRRPSGLVERLESRLAGRILRAPDGIDRYLERRADTRRTARLRSFARGTLREGGAHLLGLGLGPSMASVPWLVSLRPVDETLACAPGGESDLLLTLLPNLPDPSELAASGTIELDLEAPPGYRLERMLPPENVERLAPGDAAVWRLQPDDN